MTVFPASTCIIGPLTARVLRGRLHLRLDAGEGQVERGLQRRDRARRLREEQSALDRGQQPDRQPVGIGRIGQFAACPHRAQATSEALLPGVEPGDQPGPGRGPAPGELAGQPAQRAPAGAVGLPVQRDHAVAPSAVRPAGQVFTPEGLQDFVEPRPLETEEIAGVVQDYADAARLAIEEGGFDGVEVHGANGYLPHQFLAEGSNQRTDQYGGSAENRARFLVEVTAAVVDAVGAERVGVRLSPANSFNDIVEHETEDVYAAVVAGLEPLGLAYLHVVEGPPAVTEQIRTAWSGTLIVNPAFSLATTTENLEALLADGRADLVAVGRAFIANPDLVRRLEVGADLNLADESSFYGGTDAGYIDYPSLDEAA